MNVDSDTSNITNRDITSKQVDADEPSALIMEVFTMLKQLMVTVNQTNLSLMEMKVYQTSLNETQMKCAALLSYLKWSCVHKTGTYYQQIIKLQQRFIWMWVTPVILEIWTKPYTSNPKKSTNADHQIVKKLFGSPPLSGTNMMNFGEGSASEPSETPNPSLPLLNIKKRSRTPDVLKPSRTPSSYLPKKFSTKLLFKCTAEMLLEPAEIQVCSYLFYKFGKKD